MRQGLTLAQSWYEQYAVFIWIGVLVGLAVILIAVVVSVAARGGLVHLINEAEEGRPVKAGDGWRVGFAKWGRVFGIGFVAGLPTAVVGMLISGSLAVMIVAWLNSPNPANPDSNLIGTFIIVACIMFVLSLIGIFLGVVFAVVSELGLRYAVLQDRGVMDSLKQGWRDLWGKRGAFKMFLVQLGVGILYAIAFGIVASVLAGPTVVTSVSGSMRVTQSGGSGLSFLLIVPAAIFAAFYHASWTVFFRRMTGMEQPVAVAPVYAPTPVYAPMPPAPEYAPAPPMQPAPVPPAPEPPAPAPSDG